MEPMLLTSVLLPLLTAITTEAGKSAWNGLTALVKRRLGADSASAQSLDSASKTAASDPDQVSAAAMTAALDLSKAANADPEFASELQQWHYHISQGAGSATNIISGNATVMGNATQLHTVQGDLNFRGGIA